MISFLQQGFTFIDKKTKQVINTGIDYIYHSYFTRKKYENNELGTFLSDYCKQLEIQLAMQLGITQELKTKARTAEAVQNTDQLNKNNYSYNKIKRLFSLYDYYIQSVLSMMMIFYYDIVDYNGIFTQIDGNQKDGLDVKTGLTLKECFDLSLKKCEVIRKEVDQIINIEFPLQTDYEDIYGKMDTQVSTRQEIKKEIQNKVKKLKIKKENK